MATAAISLDTETYRVQLGILAPKLVLGSASWLEPGPKIAGALLTRDQVLDAFLRALKHPDAILVGANIAFDLLVIAAEFARRGIDIMPDIFAAFEAGRVYDLQVAEALHAIAEGTLNKDPRTGGGLKDPETGKQGRYSLSICVDLVLGRQDAKSNDEFRLHYDQFDGVPLEQLPQAAREYPVDDTRNQAECALAQTGHLPKVSPQHDFGHVTDPETGKQIAQCRDCGATRSSVPCMTRRMHRNLHEVANQTYSAFCLHLGAAWGFRIDQAKVDIIEAYALRRRSKLIQPFLDAGIVREESDGYHEVRSVLKRMIALAYGATDPCPHCKGTGKVVSESSEPYARCKDCRGMCLPTAKVGKVTKAWREANPDGCKTCNNSALVPNPNPKMRNCSDGEEITCDGTGLVLCPGVPRAEKEGVAYGRDPLVESGDETLLMPYGYYLEDAKVLKDYVPYLRLARVPVLGHQAACGVFLGEKKAKCHCPGPYRDITLTLRPNAVLATGRVSYAGYIQLFPRAPGFIDKETGVYIPSLRECIVPRGPRTEIVEVPAGYVLQPGEEILFC